MSNHTLEPGSAQAFVEFRRARIATALGRTPEYAGDVEPASPERAEYLRNDAEELYWNELAWEELTDEEAIPGGHLTELVFPGFLAFVEGLLVDRVPSDALAPASPHPDVVEDILTFLGGRYAELTGEMESGADSETVVWARAMTMQLIDLVLYRLYRLTPAEREKVESLG